MSYRTHRGNAPHILEIYTPAALCLDNELWIGHWVNTRESVGEEKYTHSLLGIDPKLFSSTEGHFTDSTIQVQGTVQKLFLSCSLSKILKIKIYTK
jgi:hypothetical protein